MMFGGMSMSVALTVIVVVAIYSVQREWQLNPCVAEMTIKRTSVDPAGVAAAYVGPRATVKSPFSTSITKAAGR
jgi:hypothetical protein